MAKRGLVTSVARSGRAWPHYFSIEESLDHDLGFRLVGLGFAWGLGAK